MTAINMTDDWVVSVVLVAVALVVLVVAAWRRVDR